MVIDKEIEKKITKTKIEIEEKIKERVKERIKINVIAARHAGEKRKRNTKEEKVIIQIENDRWT